LAAPFISQLFSHWPFLNRAAPFFYSQAVFEWIIIFLLEEHFF